MDPLVTALAAFALVVASGALWFRRAFQLRLPRNRSAYVAVWLLGGALGVLAFAQGAGWGAGLPAGLAILGSAFFCLTVAVSRQQVAADAVTVGAMLPAFRAPDEHGALFDSASLLGHPVLIKFFRGHW